MIGEEDPGQLSLGQLARRYACAHYFAVAGRREWLFQVGQCAAEIERELGGSSYQFITAWNPHSRVPAGQGNLDAGDILEQHLRATGLSMHRALGCNAPGEAAEQGWLVLDIAAEAADALARQFGQASTVYWRAGEAVRLRMQYPRPHDCAEDAFTDWIG